MTFPSPSPPVCSPRSHAQKEEPQAASCCYAETVVQPCPAVLVRPSLWKHRTSTTHAKIKLEPSSKKSSQTKHVVNHVCHLERTLRRSDSRWTNLRRYVSHSVLLKNSLLNISKSNWMRIRLSFIRWCELLPAHVLVASRIDENATLDRLTIRICRHRKAPICRPSASAAPQNTSLQQPAQQHRLQSSNSATLTADLTDGVDDGHPCSRCLFRHHHVYVPISRRHYSSPETALEPVRCSRTSRCLTPSLAWIFLRHACHSTFSPCPCPAYPFQTYRL